MLNRKALKDIAILLVSQDKWILDKVRKLIDSFGVEQIECTESYEEAVELACRQKRRFDLVIASLEFDGDTQTGIEICRRIKSEDPRTLCLIFSEVYKDTDLLNLLSFNIDGIVDTANMMKIMSKWVSVLTKKKMLQNIISGTVHFEELRA